MYTVSYKYENIGPTDINNMLMLHKYALCLWSMLSISVGPTPYNLYK